MRIFDTILSRNRDLREIAEIKSLRDKIAQGGDQRAIILSRVPLPSLAAEILDFEGIYGNFSLPEKPTPADTVHFENLFKHLLFLREGNGVETALREFLEPLAKNIPEIPEGEEDFGLAVSVLDRVGNPAAMLDRIVQVALTSPFRRLQGTIRDNVLIASKIDPTRPTRKPFVMPTEAKDTAPYALIEKYLRGTPFVDFFETSRPFSIPFHSRFEHTHIIGGSGHGKTQLLQQLILCDIDKLREGKGSIIIIDSQGDMLRTITHMAEFSPHVEGSLADRLVLLDPNDIEHPPCLNLFDFGLDRIDQYSAVEREKLLNGAIALYEYMFGALLGADLTQRQGVIFRFLGRLMMTIPGATIHTLREFMENPEAASPYYGALEGSARHFFETQFPSDAFKDTRQQILNRLWGILSNSVLERMFSNEKNKINLFEAMNSGKIVLINTAKDLLKQDGCSILGRFFIALITQAAQERAAISAEKRRACFLYIDEAQDYFDQSIEQLFNQARKYKLGLIVAHQNLGQFDRDLLATVMASTAIKIAGGVSAKDASALGKEMRCEPEFLQEMRKHRDHTEFACFVKSVTRSPLRLSVPFGTMENRPQLGEDDYEELLDLNRARYSAGNAVAPGTRPVARRKSGFELGAPEMF